MEKKQNKRRRKKLNFWENKGKRGEKTIDFSRSEVSGKLKKKLRFFLLFHLL